MSKTCLRKIYPRYLFQLTETFKLETKIVPKEVAKTELIKLDKNGILTIQKNFYWDGPSGPTIKNLSILRASLVHDALYKLMRMDELDESYRKEVDKLFKIICSKDKVFCLRIWWTYFAVRLFGGPSAKPGSEKPVVNICLPKIKLY